MAFKGSFQCKPFHNSMIWVLGWSPSHHSPHCPATTMAFLSERSEEVVVPILAWAWHQHRAPAQGFPAQILCSTRDTASISHS